MSLFPTKTLGGSNSSRFGRGSDGQYLTYPTEDAGSFSSSDRLDFQMAANLGAQASRSFVNLAASGASRGLSLPTIRRQISRMQDALLSDDPGSARGTRINPRSFSAQPLFGAGTLEKRWESQLHSQATLNGPGDAALQTRFRDMVGAFNATGSGLPQFRAAAAQAGGYFGSLNRDPTANGPDNPFGVSPGFNASLFGDSGRPDSVRGNPVANSLAGTGVTGVQTTDAMDDVFFMLHPLNRPPAYTGLAGGI